MNKVKVSIEYCTSWNYTPKAVSLTSQLLDNHSPSIEAVTLIPSAGGVFEVIAGGNLIYSKRATGRHAEEGEVLGLFEKAIGVEAMAAD